MGRASDTRQRTREAAADLVRQGHRPEAITVDLIYASIDQGSRTTINDELKRWKDEKACAAALDADMPPIVADGMRSLWVLAVEHGERAFEQRRTELETELATARQDLNESRTAHQNLQVSSDHATRLLKEQVTTLEQQLIEVRHRVTSETAERNAALEHVQALQEELNLVRRDSARHLESLRQEQERQATEFQQTVTARDAAFRAELATATQRLESAQAQMLQQVDNARTEQRHAEIHVRALQQQRDQLQSELTEFKTQLGVQAHKLKQNASALEEAADVAKRWAAERQTLVTDLANSRGRFEGLEQTVQSLEGRAQAADARLAEVLTRASAQSTPRTSRRGKGSSSD